LEPYQKEGRNSKSLTRVEGNFSACGVWHAESHKLDEIVNTYWGGENEFLGSSLQKSWSYGDLN
jgi:hypothetical protein